MNNNITDSSQVDKLLEKLGSENRTIIFNALKEGAKVLKEQTLQQLASKVRSNTPNRWNGKTMASGVRLKADKGISEVMVSIMGDFRLKFIENGTKERYTKPQKNNYLDSHTLKKGTEKSRYTGSIKATHFFRQARENEAPIDEAIKSSLDKQLKDLDK